MEELQLVERARSGDGRAFAMLVRMHEKSLYSTAYAVTRSGWDAADAVQDAFAEAYDKIGTLRDPLAFKAWLTRILVNKCNEGLRRRKREVITGKLPEPDAFTYVGREQGIDLMTAIQGLDDEFREVVALRYFRDMKIDEIAALLGCPSGTVKSRINRALGKLAAALRVGRMEVAE